LKNCKELFTRPVLTIVVKPLREYFLLLDWVDLVDSIGHNFAFCCCKLATAFVVTDVREVVNDKSNLVFVRYSCAISLELKFVVSTWFANVYRLDDRFKFCLVDLIKLICGVILQVLSLVTRQIATTKLVHIVGVEVLLVWVVDRVIFEGLLLLGGLVLVGVGVVRISTQLYSIHILFN
jgi:hypothetical protein